MNFVYQRRVVKVQLIEGCVNRNTAGIEQGAHGAIAQYEALSKPVTKGRFFWHSISPSV
jgi:hypothetical protein